MIKKWSCIAGLKTNVVVRRSEVVVMLVPDIGIYGDWFDLSLTLTWWWRWMTFFLFEVNQLMRRSQLSLTWSRKKLQVGI